MRFARAFLVLVCAVSVRADSLGDLKAAVAGLRATAAIRATVEMQRVEVDKSKKPATTMTGGAVVDALVDGEGLHVTYAPVLLARVAKEQGQRQGDDEMPAPTTR